MTPLRRQKTLTVMFTDISGFTRHTESISRDALMERLETHNRLLMPIVAHFEGRIVKTIGDALMIVFESPTNAVQCGMLMQHRLQAYNRDKEPDDEIHIKVSLNAGEVTVTEDDVFGDPVNVAAKIEKATQPDEIYFTESVFLSMNKAEVPNSFVKGFRPKGAESQEIKLYKVVQDMEDARYKRVVDGTQIDESEVQAKALELSGLAQKEVERTHAAIEHVLAGQVRGRRTTLLAAILGAAVFGAIVVAGMSWFGGEKQEIDEARRMEDAVRLYLSAENLDGARSALAAYVAEHGADARSTRAEQEIASTEAAASVRRITQALERDDLDAARAALPSGSSSGEGVLGALVADVRALLEAKDHLREGRLEDAGSALARAREEHVPPAMRTRLASQIEACARAKQLLAGGPTLAQSEEAREALARAFGDDTAHPLAAGLLRSAIFHSLTHRARDEGKTKARERLAAARTRFTGVTGWADLEREADLAALWYFASTYQQRKLWRHWGENGSGPQIRALREANANDALFLFRLGVTCHEISRKNHLGVVDGDTDIQRALELAPQLLAENRELLRTLALDWIRWADGRETFPRELLADHFFESAAPRLRETAFPAEPDAEDAPRPTARGNALAILLDKGERFSDAEAIAFIREHWALFLEDAQPILTPAHFEALVAVPLSDGVFDDLDEALAAMITQTTNKEGRWASRKHAGPRLLELQQILSRAHPSHVARRAGD